MNEYDWIENALREEGFAIPAELARLIKRKKVRQGNFAFFDEALGKVFSSSLNDASLDHRVIAFAQRRDFEAVICLMLKDQRYGRGSVLVLDDDRPRDYEVDFTYPSIEAWAQEAEKDIAERIANGWNEPYDDEVSQQSDT